MSERNYSRMMEEASHESKINSKLDQINFHKKEIEKLKTELGVIETDKIDSENKIEQVFAQKIVQDPANNPIQQKILEEEKVIETLKQEIAKEMES